ncbi:response regulator transcription factor [Inquilinus sp. OTU3971]|uniref:response regulator transcription factor n=1 Tax=Inquilinus sp. OTU3971 TaxID=3043855 RepID=UPI00313DA9D8
MSFDHCADVPASINAALVGSESRSGPPSQSVNSHCSGRSDGTLVATSITVAIIDPRALGRELFTQALATADGRFKGLAFAAIDEWELSADGRGASLILLVAGAAPPAGMTVMEQMRGLVEAHPDIPVVVMGEDEDPCHIIEILAQGVRGYIPTSVSLSVAIGALCLAMAGGTFVPASALRNAGRERPERRQSVHSMLGLSERQAAVADAVALGKPNKIIAYELDLCESTVKVHVRTIMRKLQARNRTEVAFKLHAAKSGSDSSRWMGTRAA